jgi:hypothetical protein
MIVRAAAGAPDLGEGWSPAPLGSHMDVMLAIAACMPDDDEAATLSLSFRVEPPEESPEPRTITVRGQWGPREKAVIRALCELLEARFFDAATCEFVRF